MNKNIYRFLLRKHGKSFEIMVGQRTQISILVGHIIAKPRPQIKVHIVYNHGNYHGMSENTKITNK